MALRNQPSKKNCAPYKSFFLILLICLNPRFQRQQKLNLLTLQRVVWIPFTPLNGYVSFECLPTSGLGLPIDFGNAIQFLSEC
jgi:hypothetical protein